MGIKRLLKKNLIPGYALKSIVENVVTFGVVEGIKEELKETYLEDMPITSHIYNAGRYEGKKEGYVKASDEYEKKFIKQANEFLNQTKDIRNQKDEYEQLLNDYDKYIDEMIQKDNLSVKEKDDMNQMMIIERKLRELSIKESNYTNNTTHNLPKYDERGFMKTSARHKNGTIYDDEGYNKFGYDKDGYDKDGYNRKGLDKFGKQKKIASILPKYDDEGFNKFGYDKNGYDKNGLDKFGKAQKIVSTLPKYDERGFMKTSAKHRNGTIYDDEGYNKFGYDKDGYNRKGLDKCGHPKKL